MRAQTKAGHDDRRGVFIPAEVLVITAIVVIGVAVAALAAVFPAVGLPTGVGVAVIGLLYGIYHNRKSPTNPPSSSPGDLPDRERLNIGKKEGEQRG
ncbi:hypothetical protein [Actinomadura latina]|uniref:Uncharacterized protein n=1 Tax=Actinomadura latina TaxID=163603 RepID=A0A846ZBL5_9ACTN|nr:hypothetical protein [Actinomadura latina]NKZ07895.1 hypothetical protein [Actinomadura latina]